MKRRFLTCVVLLLTAVSCASAVQANALVNRSLKNYKLCDVDALAKSLEGQFNVQYMAPADTAYKYYLITTSGFNADPIRGAVCRYIRKNRCYLYWGNVVNMAMIAKQRASWYPLDTSSHYMISPIITCNKLKTRGDK